MHRLCNDYAKIRKKNGKSFVNILICIKFAKDLGITTKIYSNYFVFEEIKCGDAKDKTVISFYES